MLKDGADPMPKSYDNTSAEQDLSGASTRVNFATEALDTYKSASVSGNVMGGDKGGNDKAQDHKPDMVTGAVEQTLVSADNDVQRAFGGKGDSTTISDASQSKREQELHGKSFDTASLYEGGKDQRNLQPDRSRDEAAAAYYAANAMNENNRADEAAKAQAFDNVINNNPHLQSQPDRQLPQVA